jgi:site-specific DNA-methyltransferase (adenine-specific)
MTQHTLGRHLVHAGDNLELLRGLPDNSVDAVVTDPPYGLGRHPDAVAMLRDWLDTGYHEVKGAGFMGRAWDAFVPQPVLWREVARVLKPGGHLVAFFGTRTYDVGTLAIRLAGLEVRDALAWVYGSGFPKSHNVAIALDKQAGAMGHRGKAHHAYAIGDDFEGRDLVAPNSHTPDHVPITEAARQWDGWGTALKPALEPIALCRLPPSESSIARNVLRWGTGGINVGGCRIGTTGGGTHCTNRGPDGRCLGHKNAGRSTTGETFHGPDTSGGRWPANLLHDGSPEAVAGMPETGAGRESWRGARPHYSGDTMRDLRPRGHDDDGGSASRYFYSAKTSPAERAGSKHPTIKPLALMRYLVRLVTPPGGVVLDPYLGSGTTLLAAEAEGVTCYGAEAEHLEDILHRWDHRHEIRRASEDVQETAGGRDEHEAQGELFPGVAP